MVKEMKWERQDVVLITASVILVLIVATSIYWLFCAPVADKDKFGAWKDLYDVVVKGTLLPLFTTLVGLKLGYTFLSFMLNKFSDR
jgi:hypothetical protein